MAREGQGYPCYQHEMMMMMMMKTYHVRFYSLKFLYIYFSSHFYFLVLIILLIHELLLLFLLTVISLSLDFFCSLKVVISMHQDYLQYWRVLFLLLFFTQSLYNFSQGCKALCIVMSFLVFWSICWSSFLMYLKNGHESLTRRTGQLFITLMGFFLYSFEYFSRFSEILFFFFLFTPLVWWCMLLIFPNICQFLSSNVCIFFSIW